MTSLLLLKIPPAKRWIKKKLWKRWLNVDAPDYVSVWDNESQAPLASLVILATDLMKQHRLLDKLAGLALVISYDLFTRSPETVKISCCDIITPQARGYHSVSVIVAQSRAASDATTAQPAKKRRIRRHSHGQLAGLPARIRAGAPASSASRLPDRPLLSPLRLIDYELALKLAVTRARLDSVENLTRLQAAPFLQHSRCFRTCPGIHSVRRFEKTCKLTRQVALLDLSALALVASNFRKLTLFGSSCEHSFPAL